MAHILLPSLTSYPFDSIKYHPEGLSLSRCSCAGTVKYYIPRAHIDHITSGRQFFLRTLVIGGGLVAYGVYAESQKKSTVYTEACLYAGAAIMFIALVCMLPSSLSISSNSGTFHSTNCSNTFEVEALTAWLRAGGGPAIDNDNIGGVFNGPAANANGVPGHMVRMQSNYRLSSNNNNEQQQNQTNPQQSQPFSPPPLRTQMSSTRLSYAAEMAVMQGQNQQGGANLSKRRSGQGLPSATSVSGPASAYEVQQQSPMSPSAPPASAGWNAAPQQPSPASQPAGSSNNNRVTLRPLRASGQGAPNAPTALASPSWGRFRQATLTPQQQLQAPAEEGNEEAAAAAAPPQLALPEQAQLDGGAIPGETQQ